MIKVRTLFSGIGSPEQALKMLDMPYELVDFCEFDKYAVKSYCAVHGVSEDKNLGDISLVDETKLPFADLMVWGFPCTDISVAGHQLGIVEGKTRSGLYYEGLRILKATMPKYSIIENVKNLVGKKFKAEFDQMLKDLEEIGYVNHWEVLNAKLFGVAQNRERVFIVSIRKDIDDGSFEFPVGHDNGLRLKDFLDDAVEEKFYISQEKVEQLMKNLNNKIDLNRQVIGTCHPKNNLSFGTRDLVYNEGMKAPALTATMYKDPPKVLQCTNENEINVVGNMSNTGHHGLDIYSEEGIAPTLKARDFKDPVRVMREETSTPIRLGGMFDGERRHQAGAIWDTEGLCPTLDTMQGGYRQPSVLLEHKIKVEGNIYGETNPQAGRVYNTDYLSPSLNSSIKNNGQPLVFDEKVLEPTQFRIRKLTPKECWNLMGFDLESFERAEKVNSNSQLYKQAGNSIVTNVLAAIFKNLLK